MSSINLYVKLLSDRTKLGLVEIDDMSDAFPCLGKADNDAAAQHHNQARNPLRPYGDTPLGNYLGTIIPPGSDVRGYGPNRRILLTPIAGDCVQAEANGRSGLMMHGGDLNMVYGQWQGLRPTYGCLRLKNEDIAAILAIVEKPGLDIFVLVENADRL